MTKYSSSPTWASITPIPSADPPNALAAISYSPAYAEAMSYLRAVMAANELSDRALALTADIIALNPAHYTVWLYRARILFALDKDLPGELRWLEGVSKAVLKNYQIWHHRQLVVERLGRVPEGEGELLRGMMALDAKNYHVWTYRQWLVRRFGLWDDPQEMEAVEELLREDVRNNSAWNHRWFLLFGKEELERGRLAVNGGMMVIDEDLIDAEVAYAQGKVFEAPQNQSPWSYLRGVCKRGDRKLGEFEEFARRFTGDVTGEGCRSSHAVEWLADCCEETGEKEAAAGWWTLLAEKYDPIRRNYWKYRIGLLGLEEDKAEVLKEGNQAIGVEA